MQESMCTQAILDSKYSESLILSQLGMEKAWLERRLQQMQLFHLAALCLTLRPSKFPATW